MTSLRKGKRAVGVRARDVHVVLVYDVRRCTITTIDGDDYFERSLEVSVFHAVCVLILEVLNR